MEIRQRFTSTLTMQMLDPQLRRDVRRSLLDAITANAVFPCRADPVDIFKYAVSEAIGPHSGRLAKLIEDCDDIASDRLNAAEAKEYYRAIRFAVSRAVSAIQGLLAEMLALGPVAQIIAGLRTKHRIPEATRIWVGNSIVAPSLNGRTVASAADIHLLAVSSARKRAVLAGVAEVKSYRCSQKKAIQQLDKHLARASRGLVINLPTRRSVCCVPQSAEYPVKIFVFPAGWRLARHYRFESRRDRRVLIVQPPNPTTKAMSLKHRPDEWRITLRWSNEALAAAAFEVVLWCLGRLGEQVYRRRPSPWPEMSPFEAGQNAAKMELYYAIRHIDDPETLRQAIKLYNVLGYGFALGSNFRDRNGRPAMLWPEDLDEILISGRTRNGGYLKGMLPDNRRKKED